jgi:nitroimidazol reductase NimA-like FMN-containing flavoprotein (pyridoxamine 5'-phosphate oxidase superfamily)
MFSESSVLEELSEGESLELLAAAPIGRLVYSEHAMPFAAPIKFLLDGMDVVMRINRRSRLAMNVAGNVVAFEADGLDRAGSPGWSVVVTGLALLVEDAPTVARFDQLGFHDRARTGAETYLRIRVELVSGRRIAVAASV